jgi:tRNA dimethylallyltransferase
MDIGTDKINFNKTRKQENKKTFLNPVIFEKLPHYMIDIINPDEDFSVAEYKEKAIKIINNIHKRGKIPFLVGGTGLYIQSIVYNLDIPKVKPDIKLRNELLKKSNPELLDMLKKIDQEAVNTINPNNKRRIVRAIEVSKVSKIPFSKQAKKGKPLYNVLQIAIKTKRDVLYLKIDKRVDEMISEGLVEETKKLIKKYPSNLPAMSGIGYEEIAEYLNNNITLEDAIQKIKYRTHQYARRQLTWFRKDKNIVWIDDYSKADNLISEFLK